MTPLRQRMLEDLQIRNLSPLTQATQRGTKLLQEGRRRRVERLTAALQALAPEEVDVLARAAAIIERVSLTV